MQYGNQKITPPDKLQNKGISSKQSMVKSLRYRLNLLERKLKRCTSPTSEARVCASIAAICTQINNIL